MGEGRSVRGRPINPFAWGENHISVSDPTDGTRRTIQIHRANGWPGWTLIDRLIDLGSDDWGIVLALTLLLEIASIPSRVRHRIRHPRRQSTEWEVLVYDGGGADYRPGQAREIHVVEDKQAAIMLAGQTLAPERARCDALTRTRQADAAGPGHVA